jgi:radical SAM protein with 4Fe4S-binding SPASM domain
LTIDIEKAILDNRINIINFSIGAATEAFYNKVRGKNLERVTDNILRFIELAKSYSEKPGIQVQIINLPEFPEMKEEINLFENFWSAYDVKINVWDKLTWGLYEDKNKVSYRYPCFSLWNSLEVNYNGTVSACCIDWKHQLIIGNANTDSLNSIWHSKEIRNLRTKHIEDNGVSIAACNKCNYWHWQPRLSSYLLDDLSIVKV